MGKPVKLSEEQVETLLTDRQLRVDGVVLRMEPREGSVREKFIETARLIAERESVDSFVEADEFRVEEEGRGDAWVHGISMGGGLWLVMRAHPKVETVEENEGFTPNVTEDYAQVTIHEGELSVSDVASEDDVAEQVHDWMFGFDAEAEKVQTGRYGGTMHNIEYVLDDVIAYY